MEKLLKDIISRMLTDKSISITNQHRKNNTFCEDHQSESPCLTVHLFSNTYIFVTTFL